MKTPENQRILKYVDEIIKEAQNQGLSIDTLTDEEYDKLGEIIELKIKAIEEETELHNDEDKQMLSSDMDKLREFLDDMINISTDVVEDITGRMQRYFINDIIENSQRTGKIEFSKKAEDLFYDLKRLNYKHIVQYTKWDYQSYGQPEAAKELIDICKDGLIKSGLIRDKFYDSSVKKYITDQDALRYMKTEIREESEYQTYKRKIKTPRRLKRSQRFIEPNPTKRHKLELISSVYDYARKQGENFAIKYLNVFNAIPQTVKENVECALEDRIKSNDFLYDFQSDTNNQLRKKMIEKYGSIEEARKKKQEFIEELIREEREKMEEKMAIQLSIDYISGMTDRSFNDLAIKTGFMTVEQVREAERGQKSSETVLGNLQELTQGSDQDGQDSPR